MKFKSLTFLFLIMVSVSLVACSAEGSGDENFKQVDIDEVNQYFEDGKSGFVLIVTDNDEYFIPTVKRLAEEKNIKVAMYNPYQSDGKNDNEGASIFPNSKDIKGGALYYMENNEVQGELTVNRYADSQLNKEVLNFFDLHE